MKEIMLALLKEINKTDLVTRLRYKIGDQEGVVEDFSFFVKDYMSKDLQEALANCRTLTDSQEKELQNYVIEKYIEIPIQKSYVEETVKNLIKLTWDKAKSNDFSTVTCKPMKGLYIENITLG